jgi:hypothetical protein
MPVSAPASQRGPHRPDREVRADVHRSDDAPSQARSTAPGVTGRVAAASRRRARRTKAILFGWPRLGSASPNGGRCQSDEAGRHRFDSRGGHALRGRSRSCFGAGAGNTRGVRRGPGCEGRGLRAPSPFELNGRAMPVATKLGRVESACGPRSSSHSIPFGLVGAVLLVASRNRQGP